ncbi:MAG: ECF-type sigma factor [Blastocatellia bacterium]
MRWRNRAHFFGTAARAMRRILVGHARPARREMRRRDEQPAHRPPPAH